MLGLRRSRSTSITVWFTSCEMLMARLMAVRVLPAFSLGLVMARVRQPGASWWPAPGCATGGRPRPGVVDVTGDNAVAASTSGASSTRRVVEYSTSTGWAGVCRCAWRRARERAGAELRAQAGSTRMAVSLAGVRPVLWARGVGALAPQGLITLLHRPCAVARHAYCHRRVCQPAARSGRSALRCRRAFSIASCNGSIQLSPSLFTITKYSVQRLVEEVQVKQEQRPGGEPRRHADLPGAAVLLDVLGVLDVGDGHQRRGAHYRGEFAHAVYGAVHGLFHQGRSPGRAGGQHKAQNRMAGRLGLTGSSGSAGGSMRVKRSPFCSCSRFFDTAASRCLALMSWYLAVALA